MKPKRLVPFLLVFVILVNSVGLVLADDTTPYTYDANGNLISDGAQCFSYNDANQLAAVRTCATNTLIAEYVYDHTGQRIIEKHYQNGALQETVYTIGKQAETVVDAGGARQDTTYFRANSEIVARESADGSKTFYHQDHLGSTGALTDAGGQVVEETRYYPFGMVRTGGALSRFLYTGQEADAETGLYYYGARFYDPALARFMQPDSMLPNPYNPQLLNRYSYVTNNPLVYIDPTGHYNVETGEIEVGDDKEGIISAIEDEYGIRLTWHEIAELSEFQDRFGTENFGQLIGKLRSGDVDEITTKLGSRHVADFEQYRAEYITLVEFLLPILRQYPRQVQLMIFAALVSPGSLFDPLNSNPDFSGSSEAQVRAFIDDNNQIYRDDELGNFIYGYFGERLGIDKLTLLAGASFVQTWENVTNGNLALGDNTGDWESILRGIEFAHPR